MSTHDYPTKLVKGRDLDNTHVLVGESGGLSAIYDDADASDLIMGLVAVQTEHGMLYLDPDARFSVYDAEAS